MKFPGSISLRVETHLNVVRDILDGMAHSGFKRILICNGHGGNGAVQQFAQEWAADHPKCRVVFHNWWNAPKTWAKVKEIDPVASHASWMENFTWTRLAGVEPPTQQKPMVDFDKVRGGSAADVRRHIGDGNFGGYYQRSDEEMAALWEVLPSERRGGYAMDAGALEPDVLAAVRGGDAMMIKGSFGSRMGPIVKALMRRFPAPAASDLAHAQG